MNKNKSAPLEGVGGRVAVVRSVSMRPEDWQYVYERFASLSPRVKDRSHYFQLLVELDRLGQVDLLGERVQTPESLIADMQRKLDQIKQDHKPVAVWR